MAREFCIILSDLKSPQNVGMIVRSAVAFGCRKMFMIGSKPWEFKKGTQAFSRKLEDLITIESYNNEDSIFNIIHNEGCIPIALEISENKSSFLSNFVFPEKVAFIVGNEATGIPSTLLAKCSYILTIPQYGPVGSLNVAVAASIGMYEFMRGTTVSQIIVNKQYVLSGKELV
jgi:23S rRNA (guanosine2251-2'-O)-methyltransferase